jgi:hypothetical protein
VQLGNIYDRWQARGGITRYDGTRAASALRAGASGYPALYGRFQGSTRPAAMTPPADTLALNPYSRPAASARPGEVPRGAQLLSEVRQTPGGGRDLYASPDGSVYRRKDDGWYRRQAGGGWSYFAPTQGTIDRGQVASARGAQAAGAGGAIRPAAAGVQGRGSRVPDSGRQVRAQEVANLERQYYARSLGQMRSQNARPARNFNRPVGRRR